MFLTTVFAPAHDILCTHEGRPLGVQTASCISSERLFAFEGNTRMRDIYFFIVGEAHQFCDIH